MSGGSKIPSAPNLSGNIASNNATAGQATSDAAQSLNTATALNSKSQDNLSSVTGTANAAAGAITNQANTNMNTYGSTFAPLQKTEADAAQAYGSNANISKLQGQAVGNANAANQAALQNSRAALAAEGVDPASIGGAATDKQAEIQGAAHVSDAGTASGIQTQQQAFGMESQANQLGLGVGAAGTSGAATGAQTAEGGQLAVNQTDAGNIANIGASNAYLNTATGANAGAVSANQAQFSDQQKAYEDQQAQAAATGQMIGTIVGGATMMAAGGAVPGAPTSKGPGYDSGIPMMGRRMRAIHGGFGIPTVNAMNVGGPVSPQGALPSSPVAGSTDTKPALLTPGEFVMPKDVTDFLGHEKLHKMIDSTREKMNTRRAIPVFHPPHVSMT